MDYFLGEWVRVGFTVHRTYLGTFYHQQASSLGLDGRTMLIRVLMTTHTDASIFLDCITSTGNLMFALRFSTPSSARFVRLQCLLTLLSPFRCTSPPPAFPNRFLPFIHSLFSYSTSVTAGQKMLPSSVFSHLFQLFQNFIQFIPCIFKHILSLKT